MPIHFASLDFAETTQHGNASLKRLSDIVPR